MASKIPPVKGQAYTFHVPLFAQADDQIKTTPTIAPGDFQVSIDDGALANLATLPSESPASSGLVLVSLSADEMDGDEIVVRAIDASGDEWHSCAIMILTAAQTHDTIDANVDAILADTNELQTDDVPGLIAALNDLSTAQVNAEVDAALADYDPPTKAELDAALANTTIEVVSAVDGDSIEVYALDTWSFNVTITGVTLTDYETIAFVVKRGNVADSAALLYVRSDTGLEVIDGTAATAGDGSLTVDSATQFTVLVALTVTDVSKGDYRWYLKGFDTTPTPDEGYTLATGTFTVKSPGLRATA